MKVVRVIELYRMEGGGRDRKLSEEGSNLWLRGLLLHILIHLPVWCHDSLHLAFKIQAPLHEMVNLKEMIN
jgi:hypothetical protein